ncbi:PE family protein, partial [Mycobacterium conspicuum]|uniref:PE family protein n=1 Tax=Mycobacterium conspicuum TaxID=44010 RepID=UPI0020135837
MAIAATEYAAVQSAISDATAAATAPTTQIEAAASDEVSLAISRLFGAYGHEYQALSKLVASFHQQFVRALNDAGNAYAGTEAANGSPLQALALFSPVKDLTGRPLFGNGAAGAPGTGQPGGDGGWIIGNGGDGGSGTTGADGGVGGGG